jgi:hypothetical protein
MRATMSRTQVKADQRHANEITDTLRTGEAIEWGLALNEQKPQRTCGACLLQILSQRLADILLQRRSINAGILASIE